MNLRHHPYLSLLVAVAFMSNTDAFAMVDRKTIGTTINIVPVWHDKNLSHKSSLFAGQQQVEDGNAKPNNDITSIRNRVLKISNIASLLCVVDCTVLPMFTILLPLVGIGASTSTARWLHELGHSIALFFVIPVGGIAAVMNFINHKNKALLLLAGVGLSFVYAANGHGSPILSLLPHSLAHDLHCGTNLHRITNILGCAFLLSSNYFARKIGGCAHRGDCADPDGHDHCGHENKDES